MFVFSILVAVPVFVNVLKQSNDILIVRKEIFFQDGEAIRGDDRGQDARVRYGKRQKVELLVRKLRIFLTFLPASPCRTPCKEVNIFFGRRMGGSRTLCKELQRLSY